MELRGEITTRIKDLALSRAQNRYTQSRARNNKATSHSGGKSGTWDIDGSIAEIIVSEIFELPLSPNGNYKNTPDVGPCEVQEVRRNKGDNRPASFISRPSDLEQGCALRPYIQVHLSDDTYEIIGWILGKEGPEKGRYYDRGGDPCWMVDYEDLHPIDDEFLEFLDWYKNI